MISGRFSDVTVVCPRCSALNEISATEVEDNEFVNCSKCHEPIGQWRDVKAQSEGRPAA